MPARIQLAMLAALALVACEPSLPALQPAVPSKTARPLADDGCIDAYFIGHSLISDIPDMVAAFCASRSQEPGHPKFRFKEQFMLGTPLAKQWAQRDLAPKQRAELEPRFQGFWFDELPKGGWDALVMIDSVPRGTSMMPETLAYASQFAAAAIEQSPGVRVLIYEPWHCTQSGTEKGCAHDQAETHNLRWRERLHADAPMWDRLVADLQQAQPHAKVSLVPAGRALGVLADAVAAGKVKGFQSITEFFGDDIHLAPYGKYFVACLHYTALTGKSPVGLPIDIEDRFGRSFWDTPNWAKQQWSAPNPEAVATMQEIAWQCATVADASAKPADKK